MKTVACTILLSVLTYCASAQSTDNAAQLNQKGIQERQAGRLRPAFDAFHQAALLEPENREIQTNLGLAAEEIRLSDIARTAFLKVHELAPSDTLAVVHLTRLFYNAHRYDEAIQYGLIMMDMKAGSRANYFIGKSYYEKESFGSAFRYLEAAAKEEPSNAEIPVLFARALVNMSNYRMAVKYYQDATRLDPDNSRLLYEMALAYSAIPDDKTAIGYFEQARDKGYRVDNDFVENMANSYVLAGQADKAVKMQEDLLAKRPADLNLIFNLADTYYRMAKYDDAIAYWDKILATDKEDARALYMIGMSLQKKGQETKGVALCNKAIEMDPSLNGLRQRRFVVGL
jgi:tetratricopeptide (TPR) repeat protein